MSAWRCPIEKLPAELARRGLRVERGEWPLQGEPTLYLVPVQPALPGLPAPAQPVPAAPRPAVVRRPSRLETQLAGLVRAATAHKGDVQQLPLSGGLRIDVMVGVDGCTHLRLMRRNVYPSDDEWVTVLSYWPYDVPLDAHPAKYPHENWRCLRASWPTPSEAHR